MKVTIRIEQDKYHFVKRSFKSLEEAERYIFMAKVAKTKSQLPTPKGSGLEVKEIQVQG